MRVKNIDLKDLIKQMLLASKEVLKKEWKGVAPVAELQIKSIIHNLEQIAVLKVNGKINE